ncbi:MAG: DUF2752 domain-containing protein [Actinomadura sp.]
MAARLSALAAALIGLAAVRIPRPPTLCLLRELTGIPCPFCGFTTAGVHLGHADLASALQASPLAVAVCIGFVMVPTVRASGLTARWGALPSRSRQITSITVILTVLAVSEIWQLVRFDLV